MLIAVKYIKFISLLIFIFLPIANILAQDIDIIPYLKQIEEGNQKDVLEKLPSLISKNPNDPSVMFLEGVLTEDGNKALTNYIRIVDNYPKSKYADAAAYRTFSYYYALGEYENAQKYLNKLKNEYPISPYLKIAERNIPSSKQLAYQEEAKAAQTTKNSEELKSKFTIQAGAFTKLSNASALKKDFDNNGFFSEIKDKVVAGTTFNVVYVGKFESKEEAENFLHVINKEFKLDGRIVDLP
jgi:tetratricopeptide (TPR) repeat protein